MSSPLSPNAVATFNVPGAFGTDSLGNPVAAATQETVTLSLRGDGDADNAQFAGTDNKIRVKGRCIDPIKLPDGVLPGAIAQCTISTNIATLTGELKLDPVIPSAYGVDEILGQEIRGEFRQFTSYGGAA
jgi:hypothetical protein